MKKDFIFISESVTEGHPDKICDQISDAIVDHFLEQDPQARVRAECAVATSILFIAARFVSESKVDIPQCGPQGHQPDRLPATGLRRPHLQHSDQPARISSRYGPLFQ